MLIDSHCHLNLLDLTPFDGQLTTVIQKAQDHDVGKMLCVSVDRENIPSVLSIAQRYPQVLATVGVHPCEAVNDLISVEEIIDLADHAQVVGLGETGLDYYHDTHHALIQQTSFRYHIQAARRLGLPVVVHTRGAAEDTIKIMQQEKAFECRGVMHCFTESWEIAKQALDLGFYISFSGIVTFKNAKNVQHVATQVPLERLLIETDAPYLTPVPYRGQANSPHYVHLVAEKIAELKHLTYDEVTAQTTENFYQLFERPRQVKFATCH